MTKPVTRIAIRLLGIALVVFVVTRIDLTDHLEWPNGTATRGTIIAHQPGQSVTFRAEGGAAAQTIALQGASSPVLKPGAITILKRVNLPLACLACALFGPLAVIGITRWWLLLRAIGLPVRWLYAARVTFIGLFFNIVFPGLTGGDVVRAFYVARSSHDTVGSALSVFVDRAIGIFGLALLAGCVLVPYLGDPRFAQVSWVVFGAVTAGTLGGALILSRRLRNLTHADWLFARLPLAGLLRRVGAALAAYRQAPTAIAVAVGMSVVNHAGIIATCIILGRALGAQVPVGHYFVMVPVALLVASIPLLPGGWGVREGAFAYLFLQIGVRPEISVPLSVLLGLSQLVWNLLGGIPFILDPSHGDLRRARAADEGLVVTSQ